MRFFDSGNDALLKNDVRSKATGSHTLNELNTRQGASSGITGGTTGDTMRATRVLTGEPIAVAVTADTQLDSQNKMP